MPNHREVDAFSKASIALYGLFEAKSRAPLRILSQRWILTHEDHDELALFYQDTQIPSPGVPDLVVVVETMTRVEGLVFFQGTAKNEGHVDVIAFENQEITEKQRKGQLEGAYEERRGDRQYDQRTTWLHSLNEIYSDTHRYFYGDNCDLPIVPKFEAKWFVVQDGALLILSEDHETWQAVEGGEVVETRDLTYVRREHDAVILSTANKTTKKKEQRTILAEVDLPDD